MSRVAGWWVIVRESFLLRCAYMFTPTRNISTFFSLRRPTSFSGLSRPQAGSPQAAITFLRVAGTHAAPPVIRDVAQIDALSEREAQTEISSLETH